MARGVRTGADAVRIVILSQNGHVETAPSEALVATLAAHGTTTALGILRPESLARSTLRAGGHRFISVVHEQNAAHMADGCARARRHGLCILQNGAASPIS